VLWGWSLEGWLLEASVYRHEPAVTPHPYRGTCLMRNSPPLGPEVGLYLGPYGGPREVGVSYERGTPELGHVRQRHTQSSPETAHGDHAHVCKRSVWGLGKVDVMSPTMFSWKHLILETRRKYSEACGIGTGLGLIPEVFGIGPGVGSRHTPSDPTAALCLLTCGDPGGVGIPYQRGTPVGSRHTSGMAACGTSECESSKDEELYMYT